MATPSFFYFRYSFFCKQPPSTVLVTFFHPSSTHVHTESDDSHSLFNLVISNIFLQYPHASNLIHIYNFTFIYIFPVAFMFSHIIVKWFYTYFVHVEFSRSG